MRTSTAFYPLAAAIGVLLPALTAAAEHAHWGYEGEHGPRHWGELSEEFAACKLGTHQSPIDIQRTKKTALPAIAFHYKLSPLTVVDNGHTIQVKVAAGSSIEVGGTTYELVQFHFHRRSEEKVKGKAFAMDAHLVHRDAAGKLAVVAVLLEPGAANPALEAVLRNVSPGEGERSPAGVSIDPASLLPAERGHYTFTGSLTTPPCSEGVTWFVLKAPVQVSAEQVAAFSKRYPHNARPVQPLGDRVVQESAGP
jgi:carbonic anhydrase